MSRWDSDVDYDVWLNGDDGPRPNAVCADCGAAFCRGRDDVGGLCDACCATRDQWIARYRRRMAKAAARTTAKKETA